MQSQFAVIPGQEELAEVPRQMVFHPTVNPFPKTLSVTQVEEFNREGYLRPFSIFSDAEARENLQYFNRLLDSVIASGGNSYSISTAHLKYGKVWDLLTNPNIVALVKDLLGENVVGWGSHFFCKMPGDGKVVAWHQDCSYWPLSPSKTVTVWLAIDDVDRENACMQFIPKTHTMGHLTYKLTEDNSDNVLNQTVEHVEQYGEPVFNELRAGQCSIHSDLLLHGSEANHSNRRRCGLTLRYCSADVEAKLGWFDKGVIVSGSVAQGTWANQPRPVHSLDSE
jgi:non-haem Fe2+, alpha-ketoglutarate-dependent halogenase